MFIYSEKILSIYVENVKCNKIVVAVQSDFMFDTYVSIEFLWIKRGEAHFHHQHLTEWESEAELQGHCVKQEW